ncbi:MAG: hypothetical protein KKD44_29600 [Proteobacteria bacterium]|nr:hypothetical protein [Pseudomonadota bacterium]
MVKKNNKILIIILIIALVMIISQEKKQSYGGFYISLGNYNSGIISFIQFIQESNSWISEDQGDYTSYFDSNPLVKQAALDTMDQETEDYFWEYINELDETGMITMQKPSDLETPLAPIGMVILSVEEHKRIRAALSAHSIWIDKNNLLPWKLSDYSQIDLSYLFDEQYLFDYSGDDFTIVVDYSPSEVYNLMSNFVSVNQEQTLYSIIDDFRFGPHPFRHGIETRDEIDIPYSLYDALTDYGCPTCDDYLPESRVSRNGCQSMSRILSRVLRNLNIPSYFDKGWYAGGSHASLFIPYLSLVLNHGDDIYDGQLLSTPTDSRFLMPMSYFSNYVEPCGKLTQCADYWTVRYTKNNAIMYPPIGFINECCMYSYDNCFNFLFNNYDYQTYFTEEEINVGVNNIFNECP